VGNVTGSNAVNVFLGIGCSWLMAAVKHAIAGTKFAVTPGSLGFSVVIFCTEALVAILILVLRRRPAIGGELGGPQKTRIPTAAFFFILWLIYVVLCSMEAYCLIPGF
jgi:solute carrier family 8 (sodium/calcium exchanger)